MNTQQLNQKRNRISIYIEILRINHWFKNIFVLIGSFAAVAYYHLRFDISLISSAFLVFGFSCLISSVNYIINGIVDKPYDAKHPRKKYRAIPMGLVGIGELTIVTIIILLITLGSSLLLLNLYCTMFLFLFFLAGIVYNIRPIRAKDVPFIDVISEAANNPIRLLLGWYATAPDHTAPPMTLIFLFWSFGCFLMTAKRYAEFRFLREDSLAYRITFRHYSEKSLYFAMIVYLVITFIFFILFGWFFKPSLLFSVPGIIIFVIWFLRITDEEDSMVKEPEKIYVHKSFFVYSLILSLLLLWLSVRVA